LHFLVSASFMGYPHVTVGIKTGGEYFYFVWVLAV
jgi:hypothetical protein